MMESVQGGCLASNVACGSCDEVEVNSCEGYAVHVVRRRVAANVSFNFFVRQSCLKCIFYSGIICLVALITTESGKLNVTHASSQKIQMT